ncbi:hypothetical protein BCV69DRAFT_143528 [Microstroma glucosiphilum]|uniref:Uncharacterized protein n=1 Tax=Pseudomicrostroma glucosiphilum TaxID=1684307 RepID=A0A316UC34_9BASI|nr:hypothetical protein BCV69DRAFT_143528 [Pseudomicrostroma glucosiphilum]PWN22424.1 hypothetical protein BCV69DRAFT_143528 [Pseudomicrostroma glucosiphilum]
MSQAAVHTPKSLQSPAGSGSIGSSVSREAEEWHLYRIWAQLVLGPSFNVSQPLSHIPSLPARDSSGRTFRIRLCVLVPVLKLAQSELLVDGAGKGHGAGGRPTEEELALTIWLTAYILMEPYLSERVEISLQPFRPLVKGCASALSNSGASQAGKQGPDANVRSNLAQALQELLSDTSTLFSRSPVEILKLQELHCFPLHASAGHDNDVGSSLPPALRPDEALTLLNLASERALSLSESRKLSDTLKSLTSGQLGGEQLGPDKFASIAVHTPRIAIELVEGMASSSGQHMHSAESSWEPEIYFQATGHALPANESKSFDFVLKLLGLNVRGETSVPFLVYRHLLPTYLSRCFSAISQIEERRRMEDQGDAALEGDDDGTEGGGLYRRSSLSEATTRDLDSLLGFLHRTSLLELLPLLDSTVAAQQQEIERGLPPPTHLRRIAEALTRRAPDRTAPPTPEQCQELYDTLDAIAVEMKAFALEMVRYRSGGELLRRLM